MAWSCCTYQASTLVASRDWRCAAEYRSHRLHWPIRASTTVRHRKCRGRGYGPGIHRGNRGNQSPDLEFAILVRDGPYMFTEEWTVVLPDRQVYRVGCRGAAQAGKDQGSEYRSCGSHAARFYGRAARSCCRIRR